MTNRDSDNRGELEDFDMKFMHEYGDRTIGAVCINEVLELRDNYRRSLAEIRSECDQLRTEVREWLCEACNTVYPGPPQRGWACVVCPKCGGETGPRARIEARANVELALAESRAEVEKLRGVVVFANDGVADTITALEARAERLAEALRKSAEKLAVYREQTGGAYAGGPEYQSLMAEIDAALNLEPTP